MTTRCRAALLAACSRSRPPSVRAVAGRAVAPRALARAYQAMRVCQMGDPADPTCASPGVAGDRWDSSWSKARTDSHFAKSC
jgi:hypothetical protein